MRTLSPRPSNKAPREEAATPLPRLEHTPPVTKIYLFMYNYYSEPFPLSQLRHKEVWGVKGLGTSFPTKCRKKNFEIPAMFRIGTIKKS
jgi:hypothetical protein